MLVDEAALDIAVEKVGDRTLEVEVEARIDEADVDMLGYEEVVDRLVAEVVGHQG